MYYFITENPSDIHNTRYSYIAKMNNEQFNLFMKMNESLENNQSSSFTYRGQFETEEEGSISMEKYLVNDAKDYTMMLSKSQNNWPDIIPRNCRYIITYIGEEITPFPNFYKIPLDEYVILQNNFPGSVRFLNADEIDEIQSPFGTIAVHENMFPQIEQLFSNVMTDTFIKLNPEISSENLGEISKNAERKLAKFYKLIGKISSIEEPEVINNAIKKVFGNLDNDTIDLIKITLISLCDNLKKMNNEKKSFNEMCEYVSMRCKEFPEIGKLSKNMVGLMY
mgnify:CR=1 FL=1